MAGVYVKGIKMPMFCALCAIADWEYDCCPVADRKEIIATDISGRPDFCPLVEVPDHGDLIDRDSLTRVTKMTEGYGEWIPSTKYKGFLTCSACEDCYIESWSDRERKWKYCPQCGIRMIGGEYERHRGE